MFIGYKASEVFYVYNGTHATFDSFYRNPLGKIVDDDFNNWRDFNMDEKGGGLLAYRAMHKVYVDFQMANCILRERSNPYEPYKILKKGHI